MASSIATADSPRVRRCWISMRSEVLSGESWTSSVWAQQQGANRRCSISLARSARLEVEPGAARPMAGASRHKSSSTNALARGVVMKSLRLHEARAVGSPLRQHTASATPRSHSGRVRQRDLKGGTQAEAGAARVNLTAVQLDDVFGDRQAQAQALSCARAAALD